MDVNQIQALGRDPIPGGDPAGENARYDVEYEQAAAEMGKLESIDQQQVDWYQVERLSTGLLATRTKDFKVASWLTVALFREHGLWGLAAGLGLCRDLMTQFWDTMFPPVKRVRARVTLLEWLAELIELDFGKLTAPSESDRDALALCQTNLQAIEAATSEESKFGSDDRPALGPAVRAIRDRLAAIPQLAPEPQPESVSIDESQPAAPPPPPEPEPPKELSTPEDVAEALPEWREEMVKAAAILRQADPKSPAGYRLLREALWGDLHALPGAGADGRLTTPCPGDDFVATFEQMLADEEIEEALEIVEQALAGAPLWLDLNLFACRALEELGRKHRKVRRAIEHQLAALLRHLPELTDLSFSDGRPVASTETRVWIDNELVPAPADDGDGTTGASSVETIGAEARRLLSRKQINEAVTLLVRSIESASSRRTRFLMRLELARFCLDAKKPAMAVPQLDLLDHEVQKFSLEEWEPELSIQVARLLWDCTTGKARVDGLAERANDIYERLCRLDPAAALTIKKP